MSYDDEIQSVLNNKNPRDVEMAREYCDEHEFYYKNHSCEPTWEENGDLDKYIVLLHRKNLKGNNCYILLQLNHCILMKKSLTYSIIKKEFLYEFSK